mgnify:CR=1 FL=1
MKTVTLQIPDYVFDFYGEIGKRAGGLSPEKVIAGSLFQLAGELSRNAIHTQEKANQIKYPVFYTA